jgi:cytochrome c-type biogenesis protein CcmH
MILWSVLVIMTLMAALAVFWPFMRRGKPVRSGSDVAVYRDQLDELSRDQGAGMIGDKEAEAARVEISRRLLQASGALYIAPDTGKISAKWRRHAAAMIAFLLLPAVSVGLYMSLGSPGFSSTPLASRAAMSPKQQSIDEQVVHVEAYLERNPRDARGWEVLAPIYMRQGRFADAVKARRHALDILGPDAARLGDLGEALVFLNNGIVTAEAQTLFQRAATSDPKNVMAAYYLGLGAKQDGRRADAEKAWRELLARAPQGAPWLPLVKNALARIDEKDGTGAAAAKDHGDASVQGMVDRLAERLKKDGSNVEGWIQLVRSYKALAQSDNAAAALADAKAALATDATKLSRLEAGIQASEPPENATAKAPAAAPAKAETSPAPQSPGPSAADIAAASKMAPEQQSEMIRGMVARLAARLEKEGTDPEGWLRLIRAYLVLNDRDKAQSAVSDARRALGQTPDRLRQFEDGVKGLGLKG